MKLSRKIILLWLGLVGFSLLCHLVLGQPVGRASFISYALQLLLFIMSIAIARNEPTGKNRIIFINFAVFFGMAPLFHFYNFIGFLFPPPVAQTIRFYFTQYVGLGAYFFLLALAIVYLTVDALFREFRAVQKYFLALAIVGGFFGYYYGVYFSDPRHVYNTEVALNWKELNKSYEAYQKEFDVIPAPVDLAAVTEMHSWQNGATVGVLYPEERLRRVVELYPYLAGNNYIILFMAPLYRNVIYMNVLCAGFILLFFGYQYRKDPPQGAYIEKIVFFLFLFCSMEILHAWSFIKSVEWQSFFEMTSIGQYASASILLMVSVFFALRLKFIRSVNGEFYEVEIVSRPTGITRWRDALDDLVIAHFFNRRAILGRLFVKDPRTKEG
jgi:hypothetical protein